MFEKCVSGVPLEVIQCTHKQTSEGDEPARPSSEKYSATLRMFALTLQCNSKKAYNYARETSDCALPHPSAITRWYSSVNGEPGFKGDARNAIRAKANKSKKEPRSCCAVW